MYWNLHIDPPVEKWILLLFTCNTCKYYVVDFKVLTFVFQLTNCFSPCNMLVYNVVQYTFVMCCDWYLCMVRWIHSELHIHVQQFTWCRFFSTKGFILVLFTPRNDILIDRSACVGVLEELLSLFLWFCFSVWICVWWLMLSLLIDGVVLGCILLNHQVPILWCFIMIMNELLHINDCLYQIKWYKSK